jgi:cell division protein FtsB
MKTIILLFSASLLGACAVSADENLEALKREIEALKRRVTSLEEANFKLKKEVDVDRPIVRNRSCHETVPGEWR